MRETQRSEGSAMADVLDAACRGLPSHFRARMDPEGGPLEAGLLEAGLRQLDETLKLDPSDRDGAFALLAADALLTLASERAALEQDGEEMLRQTIRRITERLP